MRKATHILIGAAVAMPMAATLAPAAAVGAIWWGMVGGGFPDWLDLRSDFRSGLKHRATSHSLLVAVFLTAAFWFVGTLVVWQFPQIEITRFTLEQWTIAFGLGVVSHILADSCTKAGVRPWLPFSNRRFWLLPPVLRGKSNGGIDFVFRFAATAILIVGLATWMTSFR